MVHSRSCFELGLLCGDTHDSKNIQKLMGGDKTSMIYTDPIGQDSFLTFREIALIINSGRYIRIMFMEENRDSRKNPWWQPGLILFSRLSGWIVGPIILAVIVGRWLDRKYGTEPWLFLLSVGIAFFFSMGGIVRDAMREMKKIGDENKKNKKNCHPERSDDDPA